MGGKCEVVWMVVVEVVVVTGARVEEDGVAVVCGLGSGGKSTLGIVGPGIKYN